jgi:hypothetical protein
MFGVDFWIDKLQLQSFRNLLNSIQGAQLIA